MSTTTKLAWRGNYQSLRHHHGRGAQFNRVCVLTVELSADCKTLFSILYWCRLQVKLESSQRVYGI